jgi:hypothetical protein
MKLTQATLSGLLLLGQLAILPQPHAAPVFNPANGHYYDAVRLLTNWHSAKALAESQCHLGLPGHLATIDSQAENDFITANFPEVLGTQTVEYWIGAFQPADSPEPGGNWQWVTGEAFGFPHWAGGEPNNAGGNEDAAHFYAGDGTGRWNDRPATDAMAGYVVEFETPPVRIYAAIELEFATRTGLRYQLQSSSDLQAWTDFGNLIEGTGSRFSLLVSTRHAAHRFFRAEPIDLACGLVAHYPFNGNADDASGNGNHGTPTGAEFAANRFGVATSACSFVGTSDSFIRVSDSPSLTITSAITIAAWINFEAGGTFHPRIVNKVNFELLTYEASRPVRALSFASRDLGRVTTPTEVLQAGRWTFVAATYDGAVMRLYVDGALVAENVVTGSINSSSADLNIGRNAENGSDNFRGSIDDIRIYSRALFPSEVKALFNSVD